MAITGARGVYNADTENIQKAAIPNWIRYDPKNPDYNDLTHRT